jgi:hypothetical protein
MKKMYVKKDKIKCLMDDGGGTSGLIPPPTSRLGLVVL